MNLPLEEFAPLGPAASTLVALVTGMGFGFALERGGMGDARKLAAQFTLDDLSVLKVMFSALVTAMLGVFWLDRSGIVHASLIHLPATWTGAQFVGGLVFGVGFVASGLCPGTSWVAAVSGRIDGLAVLAGLFCGVAVFGSAFGWFQPLYDAGGRGGSTLAQWWGVSWGSTVAIVTAFALLGFGVAEWFERRGSQ